MGNNDIRLHDHVEINRETAQSLFYEYDRRIEIENISLIPEGMSTSNYIVNIKGSKKKFLLKIYPEAGGNSAREIASYNYAKQYVNVPCIHLFGNCKDIYCKPFLIMDFIEGKNLKKHIIDNRVFPKKMAYEIGSSLALMHRRRYEKMALLDEKLEVEKVLIPVTALHQHHLSGFAGEHIGNQLRDEILDFVHSNGEMLRELELSAAFSHGDFIPSNILVDFDEKVWFIDFEYSMSAPIYMDIGKFFRDRAGMDEYIGKQIYENFYLGYNSQAENKLTDDWIKLSRLMDMVGMLSLIDRSNAPSGWIQEIKEALRHSLDIIRTK
jgi:tRNA A-37 threonylcarbamoyl transferase component Bud32